MADQSIVHYRGVPGSAYDRSLRQNRQHNRGLMVDTRNGFTSRNRRGFIEKEAALTASGVALTVAKVRNRYQRKLWIMQDAIATAATTL